MFREEPIACHNIQGSSGGGNKNRNNKQKTGEVDWGQIVKDLGFP